MRLHGPHQILQPFAKTVPESVLAPSLCLMNAVACGLAYSSPRPRKWPVGFERVWILSSWPLVRLFPCTVGQGCPDWSSRGGYFPISWSSAPFLCVGSQLNHPLVSYLLCSHNPKPTCIDQSPLDFFPHWDWNAITLL